MGIVLVRKAKCGLQGSAGLPHPSVFPGHPATNWRIFRDPTGGGWGNGRQDSAEDLEPRDIFISSGL